MNFHQRTRELAFDHFNTSPFAIMHRILRSIREAEVLTSPETRFRGLVRQNYRSAAHHSSLSADCFVTEMWIYTGRRCTWAREFAPRPSSQETLSNLSCAITSPLPEDYHQVLRVMPRFLILCNWQLPSFQWICLS